MSPTATTFAEVEAFAERALPFLEARPVEHTTLLTVLDAIRRGLYPDPWLCLVEEAGVTCAVALWTTARGVVLSRMSEDSAAAIAGALRRAAPPLQVIGFPKEAEAVARAWADRSGGSFSLHASLGLYRCDTLSRPPAVAGRWRALRQAESPALHRFAEAFATETSLPPANPGVHASALAEGRAFGWEHEGELVSVAMRSVPCAGVVRVQMVYTPPRWRGRGFAACSVAALTGAIQADGFVPVLFADRANPISTGVYRRLGYLDVGDWVELRLTPGSGAGG